MFRSIESKSSETSLRVSEAPEYIGKPAEGALCWIDVTAPTEADLQLLGSRFGFHPLALEDCAHSDQRPKSEEYGEYLFIVCQGFDCPLGRLDDLRWHELHAFLGKNYLVTVHNEAIPGLELAWKRIVGDAALMRRGVDFVYYQVIDRIVDDNFPILDQIAEEIERIEDSVLQRTEKEDLRRVFELKSCLVLMRKILSPQRDVLGLLCRRGDERISERTALYLRDVYDHLARIVESIEGNRDLLGNTLEAYLSAQSQRTNEIMKALAILSAVFMPLTFITGFFGQNFEHLPFSSDALMWGSILSLVLVPAGLLWWFRTRGWL
jgi:magnesium transporter